MNLKPMLAKSSDKCQNSVLDKPMWCSRKLNGGITPLLNPVNSGNPEMGIPS
jgi:hypothetical protein